RLVANGRAPSLAVVLVVPRPPDETGTADPGLCRNLRRSARSAANLGSRFQTPLSRRAAGIRTSADRVAADAGRPSRAIAVFSYRAGRYRGGLPCVRRTLAP